MTVMVNGVENRICDGKYVGDVDSYDALIEGIGIAYGAKREIKAAPVRKAMLEQFGYVSANLIGEVVVL